MKATLEKAAEKGKILKIETVTKGSAVSYKAVVSKDGKKSEVAVEADGTIKKLLLPVNGKSQQHISRHSAPLSVA